jgi:hypothetical protein
MIGSLPLILWYFHLVTPISLLANLIVVPIAFFVLAIALLSLIATPLLPWLAVIFNNANWALATLVLGIVNLFAQVPGGHFYVGEPHWPEKLVANITVLDLGAGAAVHLHARGTDWLFDCGNQRTISTRRARVPPLGRRESAARSGPHTRRRASPRRHGTIARRFSSSARVG